MANVSVTEFDKVAKDTTGATIPVGNLPFIKSTLVAYTTTTQHTLDARTRLVRLKADADVYVDCAANPTSTTADMFLEADVAEYFGVQEEGVTGLKLSFYDGVS